MATLTWQGQAEWQNAQDRSGVASWSVGGQDADTLRIGWDPDYGPHTDAEHYWPLTDPSDDSDVAGGHTLDIHGGSETEGAFGMSSIEFEDRDEEWAEVGDPESIKHDDDLSVMAHIRVGKPTKGHKYIAGYAKGFQVQKHGYWILYVRPIDNSKYSDDWEIGWYFFKHDGEPSSGLMHRREIRPYQDHVIAATFDTEEQLATISIDGHHETKRTHDHRDAPHDANMAIGDRSPGSGRYWDGALSNVTYWSRSLDEDELDELTTLANNSYLITAPQSDNRAARSLTTDAAVGADRHIDITVHQDTTGDGASDYSQTISLDNGENTYDLSGFSEVSGADYWIEAELSTESMGETPELYSVSVTTGTVQEPIEEFDDTLDWDKQSDWDDAQDRARVVSRNYGARNGNQLELGFDPEYGVMKDAAFFAPLDETSSRNDPVDVISGESGEYGRSPVLTVAGGTGTSGMYSGGNSDPGYAYWKYMDAFRHGGARTIAMLVNPDKLGKRDKAVLMGAGRHKYEPEWTLEIRGGRHKDKILFRYVTGKKKKHGKWKSKSRETVCRSFHRDFDDGYHPLIFVFDQSQDETEFYGGENWTIIKTSSIEISVSSSGLEFVSSNSNVNVSSSSSSSSSSGGYNKKKRSFSRYKSWRGKRRKVASVGMCFFGKWLDVKKLVLPFQKPKKTPHVKIGRHPWRGCRNYKGVVDEVIYWDRALNETEVEEVRRTYEDGHLTTNSKSSFGEAVQIETNVNRPDGTEVELTVYQDTSGDGEGNRQQTINVPDGQAEIELDAFEAIDGADYWLEFRLVTRDPTATPTIHGVRLNLVDAAGSIIDTDEEGVILSDEIGTIDTF